MSLKDLDLTKLSKLASNQIDLVTCLECCKYFIAPATAACGHTLCHTCWRGRRTCPTCATPLERKTLKLNIPLQTLTDHVQVLGEAFKNLFNIKLDEFKLDTPGEIDSEKDPDKNVKDWLVSSQNHFSAPIQNSETFSQDIQQPSNPLEISASNIIIHTNTKKVASPPKVVHVPPAQDDWDKIEPMPDPKETAKKYDNVVGPMDIEPFFIEDTEYNTDNPRRSSRKREVKNNNSNARTHDNSSNMHSSRDSSGDNDKKSAKQNWNNVKRMRKEFSKLNKQNRSKLNVSIEMVKKTQNLKPAVNTPVATPPVYNIDDNTPEYSNKENQVINMDTSDDKQPENATKTQAMQSEEKINCDKKSEQSVSSEPQNVVTHPDQQNNIKNKEVLTSAPHLEHSEGVTTKMPFIKKSALNPKKVNNYDFAVNHDTTTPVTSENSDDIEISIKVGNTIANIVIKKKHNDVQIKINRDREIQTSLGPHQIADINIENVRTKDQDVQTADKNIELTTGININDCNKLPVVNSNLNKTTSEKKNTASAETATAHFEITESVEKELSKIMECESVVEKDISNVVTLTQARGQTASKIIQQPEAIDDLNDLDIFNSGSVKEANVHLLKEHAPSEILLSTVQSKVRTQKLAEKRNRDNNDEGVVPKNKKVKINSAKENKGKDVQPDSEPINYDEVMGQVFASIDADMEDIRKSQDIGSSSILKDTRIGTSKEPSQNIRSTSQIQKTQVISKVTNQVNEEITPNLNEYFNEKHSENVFSILEKEDENSEAVKHDQMPQQAEDFLTPVVHHNSSQENQGAIVRTNRKNESQDYDDSDKSVVEETPQKNLSIPKLNRASTSNQSQINLSETKKISLRKSTSSIRSIINLTDTVTESVRDATVVEAAQNPALETPLTITKFADHIQYKSTPMARKSLNFQNENDDNDPEQTLCPTSEVAKTTQEREFMSKAFENTPKTPTARPLMARNMAVNTNRKYCLAGSCLTTSEIARVKILCNEHKWSYVEKYTKDITHLIVGVDEENKSQRSVKYMCALAASKWIVSFEWVKKCLQTKEIVNEEHFEALDSTGEPGPRRSRLAKKKLFEGIKFYCDPPFSVLDVDTLKNMLLAAGGRVVSDQKQIRISDESHQLAFLLAEPEHTQEDRFIYLAAGQKVVPVNYEWALNCLGTYTLGSVQGLLLCPFSMLPPATAKWPAILLNEDQDYD
uniref:RING-type E3 ubiquitin transferase BRCA1 n=1 Tax=Heliothis virescens TaxID=7102 RepID=A0A2A4JFY2_HELVI